MKSNYRTEETFITGKRGQRIAVKAYFPPSEEYRYPAVIFAHGFGGNYRYLEHHGPTIAERGIICFFLDFCGGGPESLSDGTMLDMTILSEVSDLEDVFNYVSYRKEVMPDSIFLLGESQGGLVSAYLASDLKEKVKGLILWYPAFVIPDGAAKRIAEGVSDFGGLTLSPEYDKTAVRIDTRALMRNYKGPVFIIHGDRDEIVPISYSVEADRTYEDSTLIVIPGAGHGYSAQDAVYAIDTSIDFMIRNLEVEKELFVLHINCYDSNELTVGDETVKQVLFDGRAVGELFDGEILPGAVDTQLIGQDGQGTLSARYLLEGTDADGKPCKIFIDNRSSISETVTYPSIRTDSALIGTLENAPLAGRRVSDEDGFRIVIYQCCIRLDVK